MPKVVAIIQGRMGSSRLPGKVLLDIAGKPMLQHVVERTRQASTLDAVIVATTSDPLDDPLAQFCQDTGIQFTRGSLHNVLDRYFQSARSYHADIIVRITADCPLIDPSLIDAVVQTLLMRGVDFAANRLPSPFKRTYPIGLDVEACTFFALERAWKESTRSFHYEHVMPFIYEDVVLSAIDTTISAGISPHGFQVALLNTVPDYGACRWTVDTPEDLTFIREIFARLDDKITFTWHDVLGIIENEPELAKINSEIRHKTMTEVDERVKKI